MSPRIVNPATATKELVFALENVPVEIAVVAVNEEVVIAPITSP